MNTTKKVVPFEQPAHTEKIIFTAIPVRAELDPKDARNCLSVSWENRSNVPGRCPGVAPSWDSGDLVCEYFIRANPAAFNPFEMKPNALLYAPDGEIAQWGTNGPVRRCAPCIIGEQIMKKMRTA